MRLLHKIRNRVHLTRSINLRDQNVRPLHRTSPHPSIYPCIHPWIIRFGLPKSSGRQISLASSAISFKQRTIFRVSCVNIHRSSWVSCYVSPASECHSLYATFERTFRILKITNYLVQFPSKILVTQNLCTWTRSSVLMK